MSALALHQASAQPEPRRVVDFFHSPAVNGSPAVQPTTQRQVNAMDFQPSANSNG